MIEPILSRPGQRDEHLSEATTPITAPYRFHRYAV
jgi:hypothetical protein